MKWKWNLSLKLTLRGYVENGIYMNASKYSIPCIGIRQRFNSCPINTYNIKTIEKFILINSFGYECYFGLIKEFVASILQIQSFMWNKGEFYLPSQLPNTDPSWAGILMWFTAPVLTHYICLCYLPGIIKVFRLVDSVQQSVIFCCKHLLLLQQCCNLPYVPTEYIYIARRKQMTCTDLIYRNIIA